MHISDLSETDCRWVNEHLGAFIRHGLSKRDAGKVQAHLDGCRRCTAMYLELTEVNSNLAGIIAPLLLGAAATGYLASTGGAGAAGVARAAVPGQGVRRRQRRRGHRRRRRGRGGDRRRGGRGDARRRPGEPQGRRGRPARLREHDPRRPGAEPAADVCLGEDQGHDLGVDVGLGVGRRPRPRHRRRRHRRRPPRALRRRRRRRPSWVPGSRPRRTGRRTRPPRRTARPPDRLPSPSSTVDLSGTTVDEDGVHFRALGSPDLPPVMTVRLTSQPSGVTFAPAGGDCNVAADGLSAVCSPVSGGSGGTVPGAAAAGTPSSYAAELPFLIPDGQSDTDLAIDVDVPEGFEVAGGTAHLKPYTSRTADVRLALDSPVRLRARRLRRRRPPQRSARRLHRPGPDPQGRGRRHDHRVADRRVRRGRGHAALLAAGGHRDGGPRRGRPEPGHPGAAPGGTADRLPRPGRREQRVERDARGQAGRHARRRPGAHARRARSGTAPRTPSAAT